VNVAAKQAFAILAAEVKHRKIPDIKGESRVPVVGKAKYEFKKWVADWTFLVAI
jgi:hypothetical protein